MKTHRIFAIAAFACLIACSGEPTLDIVGMVDGQSPNANERFGSSNGEMIRTITSPTSDYKVYVGTDMHIDSYASTTHTDTFLKAFANDSGAPMALILGDLVNGKYSLETASDRVREMSEPKTGSIFMALGNHDIYFNLWDDWANEWGAASYTLQVNTPGGNDLYICLDTASGYLGTKQMAWFKDILEKTKGKGFRHLIVFTHTHMFKKDGSQGHTSNFPMEETLELTSLFRKYGVELFLSGHNHCRDISYFNGVKYVIVDALEEHYPDSETGYMILNAGNDLECKFYRFDGEWQ